MKFSYLYTSKLLLYGIVLLFELLVSRDLYVYAHIPSITSTTPIVVSDTNSNSMIESELNNPVVDTPTTPQSVCSGELYTYSIKGTTGASFSWVVQSLAGVTFSETTGDTSQISFTPTSSNSGVSTATIVVTPLLNGVTGTVKNITLDITASFVDAPPQKQTICSGEVFSYTITGTTNADFSWQLGPLTGVTFSTVGSDMNSNIIMFTPTSTSTNTLEATVTVTPKLNACNGTTKNITIDIIPNPTVTVPRNQEICSGDNLDLDFSPSSGATSNWNIANLPSSITVSSQNGSGNMRNVKFTNSISTDVTVTVTVTPEIGSCTNGVSQNIDIKVRGINQSTVTAPSSTQEICLGSPYSYTPTGTNGAIFKWSIAPITDVIFSENSGMGSISFTANSTSFGPFQAVITITPKLNGCLGTPRDITVQMTKQAEVTVPSDEQEICSGDALSLNFTSSTGGTINWQEINSPSSITMATDSGTGNIQNIIITNSGTTDAITTISVKPSNTVGCTVGMAKVVRVKVKALPIVNAPVGTQEICAGNSYSFTPMGIANTTFNWEITPITGVSFDNTSGSGEISFVPVATSSTNITVIVKITPSLNGCTGTIRNLSVIVKPSASISQITPPGPQEICTGDRLSLFFTPVLSNSSSSATLGAVTWEAINKPTNLSMSQTNGNGNLLAVQLTNQTDSDLTVDIRVTPVITGDTCANGVPKIVKVTVKGKPIVNLPSSQQVCSGTRYSHQIVGTVGANFDWEIVKPIANVTFDDDSGSGTISFIPTSTSSSDIDINIKITPTNNGCVGNSSNLVVKLTKTITLPEPVIDGKINICAGEDLNLLLSDTSGNPNVKLSWTLGTITDVTGATSGTGSMITNTLDLVNTSDSGSVVYNVISTLTNTSSCGSATITKSKSITVNVNKIPTVMLDKTNYVVCNGNNVIVPFTSTQTGVEFNWKLLNPSPRITINSMGNSNMNESFTNTSTNEEILFYSVTPSLVTQGCMGTPKYFTVNILPPIQNITVNGFTSVCSGERLNLSIQNPNTEVYFKWSVIESNVIGAQSSNKGLLINDRLTKTNNNLSGSVTYTIIPVLNSCEGTQKAVVVNVIAAPQVSFSSTSPTTVTNGIANICSNQTLDVILEDPTLGNSTSFSWNLIKTNPNVNTTQTTGTDSIQEANLVHSEAVVQQLIYSIESLGAGCQGIVKNLTVNIYPQAELNILTNKDTICSGENYSLEVGIKKDLSNWNVTITKVDIPRSTIEGQKTVPNISRVVSDVLINNSNMNQTAKYKITAKPIGDSRSCTIIEEIREVIVLPASDFDITIPTKVCPSVNNLPLTTDNHLNTLGSTNVVWTNPLIPNDPKIKTLPNGSFVYDVFSSTPNSESIITLRATVNASGGCNSISKDYQFTIYSTPAIELENIDATTTIKNTDAPFELRLKNNLIATYKTRTGVEVINNGKFVPSAITDDSFGYITATYTNTDSGCIYTKDIDLRVYKVPTVTINNSNTKFCADNSSVIRLSGTPLVNTVADNGKMIKTSRWTGSGVELQTDGTTNINLSKLFNVKHEIFYIVSDSDNITNQASIEFIRNPLPNPANFTNTIICETETRFTDTTGATAGINDIVSWRWNFGDLATSTLQNPTHTYAKPGTYSVSLDVSTKDGCSTQVVKQLIISPFILPNFRWEGLCQGFDVSFYDTSMNVNREIYYTWNFGDGTPKVQGMNSLESIKNPKHTFANAGVFEVSLKIGRNTCTKEKKIFVNIQKNITVASSSIYKEGFETSNGGWVPGTLAEKNYSWEYGVPLSTVSQINKASEGASVWTTNLSGEYNNGERSWITSPCFDLKNMKTPKFSMDLFLDTAEELAGASMEISYNQGVEWSLLGNINVNYASNWYKVNTIAGELSSTGTTNVAREGWSGTYNNWERVIYDLDREFKLQNRVLKQFMLRLVFAAPVGEVLGKNGVAIDNIMIRNQAKKILVENMLNYNDITSRREELQFDTKYSDYSNEIIRINYHTNSLGTDEFNLDNPADPASRRLFYGINDEKNYIINGSKIDKNNNTLIINKFTEIALQETSLEVTTEVVKKTMDNSFSIVISSKVNEVNKYNQFKNNYTLFCVVIQPEIWSIPASDGTNSSTETADKYYGVMKIMLPNAGGSPLVLKNDGNFEDVRLNYFPKNIYNKKTAELIVFIQNILTKEIEFVEVYDLPDIENVLILSLDKNQYFNPESDKYDFNPYPIPFTNEVYIPLPNDISFKENFNLLVTNSLGHPQYIPMQMDNNQIVLDTTYLISGLYTVLLKLNNSTYRKKIIKID